MPRASTPEAEEARRAKISRTLMGRRTSAETRAKLSAWQKGRNGKAGEENGRWKGDAVRYRAAHLRTEVERGRASNFLCIDCGKQANDWSFRGGVGYSPYPADYDPRCRSCHHIFDNRIRKEGG